MTGAGAATVAWAAESSYLGGVSGTPTYRLPGTNVQVETAELSRNLLELYAPGDIEAQNFLAQQLEGQLSVSFVLKNDQFHRLVFNDSNTGFTNGTVTSAEWYLGVDYIGGTTERQIQGWAPASCAIEYSGTTEAVRVTLTGAYGDEVRNTSITPGSIDDTGDEVPGHGASLDINSTTITQLQSATITFDQISRLQRGTDQKPVEAVAGNVQETIDLSAIYDGSNLYELALGTSSATAIQTDPDEVSSTVTFDAGGVTRADYSFSRTAVDTYDWQDLVNNDADLNEVVTFRAAGVTASDPTA